MDDNSPFKPKPINFAIDLHQVVIAISNAIDKLSAPSEFHAKRVAMMAVRCSAQMNWSKADRDKIFSLALLHDIGMQHTSSTDIAQHLELEHRSNINGYQLLNGTSELANLAWPLLHQHADWLELKDEDLPEAIKLSANLIQLCEYIDIEVSLFSKQELLANTDYIIKKIKELSGTKFAPKLVDNFKIVAQDQSFWLGLHNHIVDYFIKSYSPESSSQLSIEQFKELALLLAQLVDTKSVYSKQHSISVGCIARYLAELIKLPLLTCQKLEIAGYLHDIGIITVPNKLLNSENIYTLEQKQSVASHVTASLEILQPISGIEDICNMIALHHERLNSSGYPCQTKGEMINTEARILAISDIFQALTQKRPHRDAFSKFEILKELNTMVKQQKIDEELVTQLCKNFNVSFELATQIQYQNNWWNNNYQLQSQLYTPKQLGLPQDQPQQGRINF